MTDLTAQLAEAEARVEAIKRQISATDCSIVGHQWKFHGGRNAGCGENCSCSVPVHRCEKCGDYDYGQNDEAGEILRQCEEEHPS